MLKRGLRGKVSVMMFSATEWLRFGGRRAALTTMASLALAGAAACGGQIENGTSPVFAVVESLDAAQGNEPNTFSTVLQSDVQTEGSVFEDLGRIAIRLGFKDPGSFEIPTNATSANFVKFTRYRVVYRRSDGRNTEGVDVPYSFDGAVTISVNSQGQIRTAAFTIVRAQAKLEPPLIALSGLGGRVAISTFADVTFFGQDTTGHDVTATASISVNFADWADPE